MSKTNSPSSPTVSPRMLAALQHAYHNNGHVFAGNDTWKGSVVRTNPSVLRALETRGLVTTRLGPDGGLMATITEQGRAEVLSACQSLLQKVRS